jgi:hypothetical protein
MKVVLDYGGCTFEAGQFLIGKHVQNDLNYSQTSFATRNTPPP